MRHYRLTFRNPELQQPTDGAGVGDAEGAARAPRGSGQQRETNGGLRTTENSFKRAGTPSQRNWQTRPGVHKKKTKVRRAANITQT